MASQDVYSAMDFKNEIWYLHLTLLFLERRDSLYGLKQNHLRTVTLQMTDLSSCMFRKAHFCIRFIKMSPAK